MLKTTDPQTAARFSYLASGGEARAAEAGARTVSEWSDI